jgi:alpha-glucoside transport system permease protein
LPERAVQLVLAIVAIPALLVAYQLVAERGLPLLPRRARGLVEPWLWVGPAAALFFVFLLLPAFDTVYLSLFDRRSEQFVGLDNYSKAVQSPDFLIAVRNSAAWLLLLPLVAVVIGLLMAVLTDRVPYGRAARATLFVPVAISSVAGAVIWRFMYDYRPPGAAQTGALNAALTSLVPGVVPQAWLINAPLNSAMVIVAAVWMSAGFCMVILAAGLKGIPVELLDSARVDGASEWQSFRLVTLPLLAPTITVVVTTMAITALKSFDLVYVMTSGNFETDVIATRMFKELFSSKDVGYAAAIAVLLMLAILPVMVWNLGSFRRQESAR